MKTSMKALCSAAVAACAMAAFAPAASAAPVAPVTGWSNGTAYCGNNGVSVFPFIVTNTQSEAQTGSITTGEGIGGGQVQVSTWQGGINCNGGSGVAPAYVNFTVQPGQTQVYWVGVGVPSDGAKAGTGSHNIAIGGGASGSGASWYDFAVSLNGAGAFSGGTTFSSMQVQYDGTGGTDTATNGQNLFNIIPCNSTSNGVYPASGILTPYSSACTTAPPYQANEAVCAAWFPEGTFQTFSNTGANGFNIQAAQTYQSSANEYLTPLAIAGSGSGPINSIVVTWGGASSGAITPSTTPGSNTWWGQDPVTNQWVIANLEPDQVDGWGAITATVAINGNVVGTVNYNPGYNSAYNPSFYTP